MDLSTVYFGFAASERLSVSPSLAKGPIPLLAVRCGRSPFRGIPLTWHFWVAGAPTIFFSSAF